MAFDFSTLVTDRKQSDVAYVKQLIAKIVAGTETEAELAEWKSFTLKGSYNYTDLNRVTAAMADLKLRLESYGYAVPGYQRIEIEHPMISKKLPEGYLELTHIESTGTQYVDTGVFLNNNSKVVADCEITYSTGWAMFLGSYGSSDRFSWWTNGAKISPYYGATGKNADGVTGRTILIADKNKWSDGVSEFSFPETSFVAAHSMYLFSVNNGGNYANAPMKLYSCQVYDNGTLVRDMIPVVRKQDEEAGLYDLVNGMFYGNAGTGAFIAGGYLPKDYKRVEYIESTGDAYINTQYVASSGTTIEVDASTEYSAIEFGARIGAMNNAFLLGIRGQDKCARFHFANNGYAEFSIADPQNKHTYMISGDGKCYFDGVLKTTQTGSFSNNLPTYLFCINNGGPKGTGAGKIYRAKITNSGVVVRDYVPVVRVSDGASGMYDLENGVFYQNAGTGAFKTGGIIQEPSQSIDIDPYTWYEFDWPTPEAMTMYLLNLSAIRSVLAVMASTPKVPSDMDKLMVQEANDIEAIVRDVYRQITIMSTTFIACGEALCGGDNL